MSALRWVALCSLAVGRLSALILSGSADSFARYPKWAQTFENQLSFEFKTHSTDSLLLYTDDGGIQGNFYVVTIVDGRIQLDFRLGDEQDTLINRPVITIRVEAVAVADGKWHRFVLFQAWENVKLQVDDTVLFKILTQRSFIFGNLRSNSDVFVGGVPKEIHQLESMSSPLRRHSKRFAGSVKNLVYRLYPQGVSSPQLIDSFGTRQTDDDYCSETMDPANSGHPFCRNGGRCFSTNDGPKCDCGSGFEGRQCEKPKPDAELSFYGTEWIGYDVSNTSSALVLNRHENISLMFKTRVQNGLLFVAGDRQNYVQLTLERGILIAASKLYGSDKRIIRQRYTQGMKPTRYDDDQWHSVHLQRDLRVGDSKYSALTMRLVVDGNSDEVKQFASDTEWLGNTFAYVGGLASGRSYVPQSPYSFKGCMKKIRYDADVQMLDVIELADQGYGKSVIRTGGDLSFSCMNAPFAPPEVLSFGDSAQSFVTLPKWNSYSSGSLGFQFRTQVSDGLILYHGVREVPLNGSSDFIAFEISDGHLFMVIDLGSGGVRLQTTSKRVNEGNVWHSVSLERVGRQGSVTVDTVRTDFSTPGVSANLIIEEPIYIGAAPWVPTETSSWAAAESIRLPATLWSAHLRSGFVGCLKNVRINGMNAQIAAAFLNANNASAEAIRYASGISVGCAPFSSTADFCASNPCHNFGRCSNSHSSFRCDCSATIYDGPTCEFALNPVDASAVNNDAAVFRLPELTNSNAELIEVRFKTADESAVLLDSRAADVVDRILLVLLNGELSLRLYFSNDGRHVFTWGGTTLNDDQWHTVKVNRRGVKIALFVDGKWEPNHFLPEMDTGLLVEELSAGRALRPIDDANGADVSAASGERSIFEGSLLKLTFNQFDVLRPIRGIQNARAALSIPSSPTEGIRPKSKANTISFNSENGFAQYPIQFAAADDPFRISLKLKTIASSGLLAVLVTNSSIMGQFDVLASLELVRGKIRYRFGQTTVIVPEHRRRSLNDLKWHTVSIEEDASGAPHHQITVDNEVITLKAPPLPLATFSGHILLAGFPRDFQSASHGDLATVSGFRGCLSTLKVGSRLVDLVGEIVDSADVYRGCHGPSPRCGPQLCQNGGVCHQGWHDIRCDCDLTAHSGKYCEKEGTTYNFDGSGTAIYYEFLSPQQPNTVNDHLVLGFRTQNSNGVLFGVQCAVDGDYLTVFVGGGNLQLRYNLGSKDHHVGFFDVLVNDGNDHSLRLRRSQSNITLTLDAQTPLHYAPADRNELFTLNTQQFLSVGAAFNILHSATIYNAGEEERRRRSLSSSRIPTLYDEFVGQISGLNFNGLMVLDLFAGGDPNTHSIGTPKLLKMGAVPPPFDPADFPRDGVIASAERSSEVGTANSDEAIAFIESGPLKCLSAEQHSDCDREVPDDGFFTPVLPKALETKEKNERNRVRHSKVTKTSTSVLSTLASTSSPLISTTPIPTNKRRTTTTTAKPKTSTRTLIIGDVTEKEDYGDEEEEEQQEEEEYEEGLRKASPATYAPFARAQLVNSGPDELDALWTDLSHASEFKAGGSWRRATTTTASPTTTSQPLPPTSTRSPTTPLATIASTLLATTSQLLTTTTERIRQRTTLALTSTGAALVPVRPTTPMGELVMSTTKAPIDTTDYPRTQLISIASVSVIVIIAVVMLCVFRCRGNNNPPNDSYPMVYSGKTAGGSMSGGTLATTHGYTPIPSEMSPPTQHAAQFAPDTMPTHRMGYDSMNGAATLPIRHHSNGGMANGGGGGPSNGYQPLGTGQLIVNANGQSSPVRTNGQTNGVLNGGSRTLGPSARKKEFKEWYV